MMNRNAKIALGCGAGGCLVLILLVLLVGVLIFFQVIKAPGIYSPNSNRNYNFNSNSSNYNSNYNANTNTSDNDNLNSNSDSSDSSSMSNDDKHKLFQAAGITQDSVLILRVLRKIGYPNGTGAGYQEFAQEHAAWAIQNVDFIRSVLDPEKARAYVDAHIDD